MGTNRPPDRRDFLLAFEHQGGREYRTLVLNSPAGRRPEGVFICPFDEDEVAEILADLGTLVRNFDVERQGLSRESSSRRAVTTVDLERIGLKLYEELFKGQVRDAFRDSLTQTRVASARLRLRLVFGIGSGNPDSIAGLPWELLRSPEEHKFLAVRPDVSLVRELKVASPGEVRPLEGKIRVLAAMANPSEQDPLALDIELRRLRKALVGAPVEVTPFDQADISELRDRLAAEQSHVLHFMGHGGFDYQRGEGHLLFQDHGAGRAVSGPRLAELLDGLPKLRLTVLNACHAGALASGDQPDPYLGVASALVNSGQAAVIAMQAAIPDRAAVEFSAGFYRALARSGDIETALHEGRLAVRTNYSDRSPAWALPALFMAPTNAASEPPTDEGTELRPRTFWPWLLPAAAVTVVLALILSSGLDLPRWIKGEPTDVGSSALDPESGVVEVRDEPEERPQETEEALHSSRDGAAFENELRRTTEDSGTDALDVGEAPIDPAVPLWPVVPRKTLVLAIDGTTRELDRNLGQLIATVLAESVGDLDIILPAVEIDQVDRWLSGDPQALPNDGRAPWGAQYILIATARSRVLQQSSGVFEGRSLNLQSQLIYTDGQTRALRKNETENGLGASADAALLQAAERCLVDIVSALGGAPS